VGHVSFILMGQPTPGIVAFYVSRPAEAFEMATPNFKNDSTGNALQNGMIAGPPLRDRYDDCGEVAAIGYNVGREAGQTAAGWHPRVPAGGRSGLHRAG
jgi:hypothetical protein